MSVSGINPSVNSVQPQQQNKSKVIPPVVGTAVGAGVGIATSAGSAYKRELKNPLITMLNNSIKNSKAEITSWLEKQKQYADPELKKMCEGTIKDIKLNIAEDSAKLDKLKKAVPMKVLKAVAKSKLPYILAITGLAIGLYVNHKNKNVEPLKNERLDAQV